MSIENMTALIESLRKTQDGIIPPGNLSIDASRPVTSDAALGVMAMTLAPVLCAITEGAIHSLPVLMYAAQSSLRLSRSHPHFF